MDGVLDSGSPPPHNTTGTNIARDPNSASLAIPAYNSVVSDDGGAQEPVSSDTLLHSEQEPIILQVGEQRFYTSRDNLTGSGMLNSMTSGRWNSSKQLDGSYFIDRDPGAFKHVLSYLRLGVFPLQFDQMRGHNYAAYAAIRAEADYLGVEGLVKWLDEKQYLKAVTVVTTAEVVEDEGKFPEKLNRNGDSSLKFRYHPSWKIVKRYVCPRGIVVHYDNQSACGRVCKNRQGDADNVYDKCPVLSTLVLTEKTVYNGKVCTEV